MYTDVHMDNACRCQPSPPDIELLAWCGMCCGRWDDVVRVLPPPTEVKKKQLELDDSKAQQVKLTAAAAGQQPAALQPTVLAALAHTSATLTCGGCSPEHDCLQHLLAAKACLRGC